MSEPDRSGATAWTSWLMNPVAIHSLIVFRIAFGLMMAVWVFDYLRTDRVALLCAPGSFHFTYQLFSWVKPWPGQGMEFQFAAMGLAAVLMAAGALYRPSCIVFALGFTHFFLVDRTNYQNHYYLILLLSWLMVLLPANRLCSVDALNGSVQPSVTISRWCLLLLQFHIALPYVYGGIAKIEADWLSGDPMRNMLMTQAWYTGDRAFAEALPMALMLTWGGLLFDLLIVPAVLWRRTRWSAFVLAIVFHLTNSLLFNIHVFPWLMIAATTVFFPPDWPRRLFSGGTSESLDGAVKSDQGRKTLPRRRKVLFTVLGMYCCFHVLWPLRHLLYDGHTGWTERGHYFSWRMMLRGKTVGLRYYLTDPETGETVHADIRDFLNHEQEVKFAKDPAMILDLAHGLAAAQEQRTGKPVEIRALVLASLNGRKPQLLIDPAVNLAAEPKGWFRDSWIVPLTEPRREDPWVVPLNQWERYVEVPRLPFLVKTHQPSVSQQ